MNRPLLVPAFSLVLGLSACATRHAGGDQELLARVDQFHEAIREGDPDKYADVFTDDFLFTWSKDGQIYSKEQILPNVVPTPEFRPIIDEHQVRVHERAAVVSFRVRKDRGAPGVRVTFSYVKVGRVWKVMATHSTAIVETPVDDG